jgi:hypothetical protein
LRLQAVGGIKTNPHQLPAWPRLLLALLQLVHLRRLPVLRLRVLLAPWAWKWPK